MDSNKAQELVEETKERLPNNNEGGGKIDYIPSTRNFSASLVEVGSRSPVPGEGEVENWTPEILSENQISYLHWLAFS